MNQGTITPEPPLVEDAFMLRVEEAPLRLSSTQPQIKFSIRVNPRVTIRLRALATAIIAPFYIKEDWASQNATAQREISDERSVFSLSTAGVSAKVELFPY